MAGFYPKWIGSDNVDSIGYHHIYIEYIVGATVFFLSLQDKHVWLGMRRDQGGSGHPSDFYYVGPQNAGQLRYHNFAPGRPKNITAEKCVATQPPNYKWFDIDCTKMARAMCEF